MITRRVRDGRSWLCCGGVLGLAGLTISPSYAANDTEIYIVQGLPGKDLDVAIDGESVAEDVKTAAIAGPFKVKPGSRMVTFSENGTTVPRKHFLDQGRLQGRYRRAFAGFLVRRSSGDGVQVRPVKVPNGKARLVVSHVAAVPPADILVNGQVLFANIANGESLELVVPVATYKVSIVPSKERARLLRSGQPDGQGRGNQPRLRCG